MRARLAQFGTASTLVLALALCPSAWSQQERGGAAGERVRNPTAGQDRTQTSSAMETIRGVVAAVTAEAETMIDYRTNRAVAAEAAFLTVVGSPVKSEGFAKERTTDAQGEKQGSSAKKRHNVYIVWLTPRTKICESSTESQKSRPTEGQTEAQKREVAFDQLEVGDHVEIQFSPSEETGANTATHQTERMRGKHGRNRTFVGLASSITILPSRSEGHSAPGAREKSSEIPR